MRTLTLAGLAVLALTACGSTAQPQPVDLSGVTAAIEAVGARVDDLSGRVDLLSSDINVLTEAAINLQSAVNKPLDVSNVAWGALTGVVLQTVPPTIEVTVQPGPCPDGTPTGLHSALPGTLIGASFHPLPVGTHCLISLADEAHKAAGVTVEVRDGVIVAAALIPNRQAE